MAAWDETWYDEDAGPLVRLYARTGGRTFVIKRMVLSQRHQSLDHQPGSRGGRPTRGLGGERGIHEPRIPWPRPGRWRNLEGLAAGLERGLVPSLGGDWRRQPVLDPAQLTAIVVTVTKGRDRTA